MNDRMLIILDISSVDINVEFRAIMLQNKLDANLWASLRGTVSFVELVNGTTLEANQDAIQ